MEKENMSLKVKVETIGCQSVDQKKKTIGCQKKIFVLKKGCWKNLTNVHGLRTKKFICQFQDNISFKTIMRK